MAKAASGSPGYDALKAALKSGDLAKLYIFHGEEAFLRDYYLERLQKKLVSGPMEEFNFHRFSGRELSVDALLDAIEALPMMAERSMVLVDDYDPWKADETDREKLAAAFSDLPDYCCVVLCYDTLEYKPDRRLKKLTAVMDQQAQVVEFKKQSEQALSDWIAKHFRAVGKDIAPELCRYLIYQTGGAMTALSMEIQKIASYTEVPQVQKVDIDAVVTPTLEASAFDLTDRLAEGNFAAALSKLQVLFQMQEEPIVILGAIGANVRRIYAAKLLRDVGKTAADLAELYAMKSYGAQKAMAAARQFSMEWCRRAVLLCAQTDYQLKSSYDADKKRVMELLLVRLAENRNEKTETGHRSGGPVR